MGNRSNRARATAICAVITAMLFLATARVADAGDPETGRALAQSWCTPCHVVETGQADASDAGPPFQQIADDPARTDDQLRVWLADPHPPMPNLNLGRTEIDHLIAYIRSLGPEQ